MTVLSAIRPLRTAAIERLKAEVTLAEGRVYTGKVPQRADVVPPFLVIGSYGERAADHYGHGGSDSGFDIRGTVRVVPPATGDAPLLALYEQVYAALHGYGLEVEGHQTAYGVVRLVTDYGDPDDGSLLHFVARYEATTAVAR